MCHEMAIELLSYNFKALFTIDCGDLGSRIDDVYIEVGRIRKRDAFSGY